MPAPGMDPSTREELGRRLGLLTGPELALLQRLSSGATIADIALADSTAEVAVTQQVVAVLRKLGVTSKLAAMAVLAIVGRGDDTDPPDWETRSMDRPATAQALDLEPHPEGGWYRQTWRSPVDVTLPDGRVRPSATLIYFLLPAGESSAWHKVASDELWMAHEGVVTVELGGSGAKPELESSVVVDVDHPQGHVPAGVWQRTVPTDADALVSCLVSPGFDFADFELEPPG